MCQSSQNYSRARDKPTDPQRPQDADSTPMRSSPQVPRRPELAVSVLRLFSGWCTRGVYLTPGSAAITTLPVCPASWSLSQADPRESPASRDIGRDKLTPK